MPKRTHGTPSGERAGMMAGLRAGLYRAACLLGTTRPPDASRPQRWRPRRGLGLALLAVALVIASAVLVSPLRAKGAWSIVVVGDVVAVVEDRAAFEQELRSLLADLEQEYGQEVRLGGEVTYRRAPKGAETLAADRAAGGMRALLPLVTGGCWIEVDGVRAVACHDRAEAEQAVAELLAAYEARLTKKSGVEVLSCKFSEAISYAEGDVALTVMKPAAEAAAILERGTDKVVEHAVQKGDTLWDIARRSDMAVADLRKANPSLKGDLIHVGDKLSLIVPDPYLNLVSEERYVFRQAIAYPTQVKTDADRWPWERIVLQAGERGEKEVTVEISRQNGEETARRLISEVLLKQPLTQVVVQGTKVVPNRGTGRLVWPVVGQITSTFGSRYRSQHTGIDIGAPRGTPVLAADSGTVTTSQSRMGGYGQVIMIDHGGGALVTVYAHLDRRLVSVGDVVEKGQVIGHVGNTGRSTGPHLHFETRLNGQAVNPIQFYPSQ